MRLINQTRMNEIFIAKSVTTLTYLSSIHNFISLHSKKKRLSLEI